MTPDPDTERLIPYLSQFLLESRLQTFRDVLAFRTRYVTVVLEDIYQAQNASAALRTCDCFGIQDVHIIENRNKFTIHRDIAMGSNKWLSLYKYNNTNNNSLQAVQILRQKGYRIVATDPGKGNPSLQQLDIETGKIALFFGTELSGISQTVHSQADAFIRIPMFGFTESYNISVSVALCLQDLIQRLHASSIQWQLCPEEQAELLLAWIRKSVKNVGMIEKRFMSSSSSSSL